MKLVQGEGGQSPQVTSQVNASAPSAVHSLSGHSSFTEMGQQPCWQTAVSCWTAGKRLSHSVTPLLLTEQQQWPSPPHSPGA